MGRRARSSFVFSTPADAHDGLALDVLSATDHRGAPRPAVVLVHGGGWVWGGRGGTARWNEWLADEGYVVFDVDYRLAPPPTVAGRAERRERHAIAWIRVPTPASTASTRTTSPSSAPSAGGHLALLAAYSADDRPVAAVAAFYPDTDLTTLPPPRRPRWASAGATRLDRLSRCPAG